VGYGWHTKMLTKIRKKATKLSNAFRYRKRPEALPCFWHLGSPNFGDDLNPELLAHFLGRPVYRHKSQNSPHILGVGSILERANPQSIVIGSGFIRGDSKLAAAPLAVFTVRGELTKNKLGVEEDILLGDPGMLMPSLLNIPHAPVCDLAIVPHVDSYQFYLKQFGSACKVIDPSGSVRQVVSDIASAEVILSQSLHGLVMADAMNIPNLWLAPHQNMLGGEFKFHDYYSTCKEKKSPISTPLHLKKKVYIKAAYVSNQIHPLAKYQSDFGHLLKEATSLLKL
jgi:pyruvyltransferase